MNAIVGPLGQPTPGSARPGNLYADLASRTLWLGVDLAVDSTGSVLISDMLQSMAAIEDSLDEAKAYTDDVLANGGPAGTGYALLDSPQFTGNPRAPTPTAGDADTSIATTKFVADAIVGAASKGGLMVGMILLYSGPYADIGVGDWVNWWPCDGSHGTPDLRNRFVFGAGVVESRTPNPKAEATSKVAGAHTHPVSSVALTTAQIPSHQHGPGTLEGDVIGATGQAGTHNHFITCTTAINTANTIFRPHLVRAADGVNAYTETEPNHTHPGNNARMVLNAGLSGAQGGGAVHTHTTDSRGDHSHGTLSSELRDALPSMALVYIMKIT